MLMKLLYNKYHTYLYIAVFVLVTSFLVWLPFVQQLAFLGVHIPNTDTGFIYRHFDGLLYVIAAKSFYDPAAISMLPVDVDVVPKYYAAHLPLYPLTLITLAPFVGWVKSAVVSTVLFSILLGWFFYFLVKKWQITKSPLLLTFIFLMFPRFLVVRSIGAPESMFILLILLSLYLFEAKRYWFAGFMGGLATMTKIPGILLFPALSTALVVKDYVNMNMAKSINNLSKSVSWSWLGLLLIPAGLLTVFLLYLRQYGDFWTYWHTGGVVPMPYLFSAFDAKAKWVGDIWLEEIVFYFALYSLSTVYLWNHAKKSLFYFSAVFLLGVFFVQHKDIGRYSLPLWPLACIAFERFLTSKRTLIALLIIVPAIYMFAWNFMQGNVMPVSNWSSFM